ncbi:MAG: hypothetical protein H7293_12475, partial [Candidatus Saccharibacteria bacterium]|nr:hypothetical protein [Rhodoferax sp.]
EALVSTALRYINTGSCSTNRMAPSAARTKAIEDGEGTLLRDPIREIMLLDGGR